MRMLLLSFTALSLVAAVPAFAQTGTQARVPTGPGKVVTGPPDLPSVQPLSHRSSNINASDTRSRIAPALPSAGVGANATPSAYLRAAQGALAAGRTGQAQEALENAETQLLNRSVPMDMVNQPDQNPAVHNINSALQALGSHDLQTAMQLVEQTIPMTDRMQTAASAPMPPVAGAPPLAPPAPHY